MNLPEKNLDTPFNITRSSHVVLTVKDLEASRLFYTEVVGLVVTEQTGDTLYLRGVEEACHHSLVLKQSKDAPRCERIGMRVLREKDLEPLKAFFDEQGPARPPGRTCRTRASTLHVDGHLRRAAGVLRVDDGGAAPAHPVPPAQGRLGAAARPLPDPGAGRAQGAASSTWRRASG